MSKYYQSLFFCGVLLFFTWRLLTEPSQSFDKYPHTQWPANTWVLCFCLSFRCVCFLRYRIILRCSVSKAIRAWRANNSGLCIWKNFNKTLIITATKITQDQYVFPKEILLSETVRKLELDSKTVLLPEELYRNFQHFLTYFVSDTWVKSQCFQ